MDFRKFEAKSREPLEPSLEAMASKVGRIHRDVGPPAGGGKEMRSPHLGW